MHTTRLSCCVLDIHYSNKLNVVQCPKSSVENVHLELTLHYGRNYYFHLHPFLQWTPFDSTSTCGFELHDWEIALVNAILCILGAAVGRIGEHGTTLIRKNLCFCRLRTPKISLLRWTAIATRVM